MPINQIEAAIDELRLMDMDKDSEFFEKMSKFQEHLLDYMEATWVRGNFAPKLWNMWRKASDLEKPLWRTRASDLEEPVWSIRLGGSIRNGPGNQSGF